MSVRLIWIKNQGSWQRTHPPASSTEWPQLLGDSKMSNDWVQKLTFVPSPFSKEVRAMSQKWKPCILKSVRLLGHSWVASRAPQVDYDSKRSKMGQQVNQPKIRTPRGKEIMIQKWRLHACNLNSSVYETIYQVFSHQKTSESRYVHPDVTSPPGGPPTHPLREQQAHGRPALESSDLGKAEGCTAG